MVCLGLEPGVAGWKVQTNPLSYSGTRGTVLEISLNMKGKGRLDI